MYDTRNRKIYLYYYYYINNGERREERGIGKFKFQTIGLIQAE